MARVILFLILIVVLVLAVGVVYFGTQDLPAPTTRQERVLPNDRFPGP